MPSRRRTRLERYRRFEKLSRVPNTLGVYALVWVPSVATATAVPAAVGGHGAATFFQVWRTSALSYTLAAIILTALWTAVRWTALHLSARRITLADIPTTALPNLEQIFPSIRNADWADAREHRRERWEQTLYDGYDDRSVEVGTAPALGRRLWRQLTAAGVTRAKLRILQDRLWTGYAADVATLVAATEPSSPEQLAALLHVLEHHQRRLDVRWFENVWGGPHDRQPGAQLSQLVELTVALSDTQLLAATQLAASWTTEPADLLHAAAQL